MIHIKDGLKQYKDKYSDCYKYAGVYVKVIQDIGPTSTEALLNVDIDYTIVDEEVI